MQVFKTFFKIAKSHMIGTSIYFIIYAFIVVLLSVTANASFSEHFQRTALSISITDKDNSAASTALVNYLASIHEITDLNDNPDALLDQIYYRTVDYALTIPSGFEENFLSGSTDEQLITTTIPGSTASYYVDQQISQYLRTLELYLSGGYTLDTAIEASNESVLSIPEVEVLSFHEEDNQTESYIFYFFQYLPYIFIVILFSGLAPILITLNSNELKARTICSSLPPHRRIVEMSVGCIIYSLIIWGAFMFLGTIVYGKALWIGESTYLGILNSFVFMMFSTAITLFISCFALDGNLLSMAANIIGISMSFLCGVFVPQSMLSAEVLNIGKFFPAYWYIRANNMLAGFGKEVFDMQLYLKCIGIQLLYVAAIFAVTIVVSRQTHRH